MNLKEAKKIRKQTKIEANAFYEQLLRSKPYWFISDKVWVKIINKILNV